uniref:ATP synthase subunit O, mitochondrial n=1 Tax=Kalanchoe fedtschenkoi TaxID=63787 RepID=A0A7N0TBJ9_KALFE
MASSIAQRLRSALPHINRSLRSDSLSSPNRLDSVVREISRNYATATGATEKKVKVPIKLFGGSGNYASALYIAAAKTNSVEKVESELIDFVEAAKKSPTFSQFMKDLSVPADIRVKAVHDVTAQAKFSDVTKNFIALLAQNGRLVNIDTIAKRYAELAMAHKGEVKAIVTTVIPLPAEEEKELIETLQYIIGEGKKVQVEQKIDPSILGGIVVEFDQKVLDMSIKTRAKQMERFLREPINFDSL